MHDLHPYTNENAGPIDPTSWETDAVEHLYSRMCQYDEGLEFNLVAISRSPIPTITAQISQQIHSLRELRRLTPLCTKDWATLQDSHPFNFFEANPDLSRFQLTEAIISAAPLPQDLEPILSDLSDECTELPQRCVDYHASILSRLRHLIEDYEKEVAFVEDAERAVKGRKKDYTPAIHAWVKKLAEKGLLEDLAT